MQISDEEAVERILRQVKTDVVSWDDNPPAGAMLQRLDGVREMLSGGELKLLEVAESIWFQRNPLGGLDAENRRVVLDVLRDRFL